VRGSRNYITNFGDFISPFPNYFSLGDDVRYLIKNGVVGLFQEGSYEGPGGDMDELKDYLLGRVMWDQSRNDTEVINTFLEGYYGAASAPHILAYMKTMHDSAHAHAFHMAFSFAGTTANYLTPATVLAGAQAFAAARLVANGRDLEHVQRTAISMYWVILHRWEEMLAFAKTSGTEWPVEKNIEAAFSSFAIGVNLTQKTYNEPLKAAEGGPPLDLAALRTSLKMGPCPSGTKRVDPMPSPCHTIKCPAGWTRNGTDIRSPCDTPVPRECTAGTTLARKLPTAATSSSVCCGGHNLTIGQLTMDGYTGWLQFTYPPGTLIGNLSAEAVMTPSGHATHTLTLDGHPVHEWSEAIKSGEMLTWAPPTPVGASVLRITTTQDISWVAWGGVVVSAC
jgi:hypothetical protein